VLTGQSDVVHSLREDVAAACRRLAAEGLVPGTSGNVSARLRAPGSDDQWRDDGVVAVTASGLALAQATADDVIVVALDGTLLIGDLEPTSELPLHLAVHARIPAAGAVVHTHAPASTAVGCLVDEVPPIHYATLLLGGPSVPVAPFATFGTPDLADAVLAALRHGQRSGALMAHHGAITWGAGLPAALERTAVLEWLCEVYLRAAAAGTPRVLTASQLADVAAELSRRHYGNLHRVRSAEPTQPRKR
jgi:L-fuculose-phosphate aldolase